MVGLNTGLQPLSDLEKNIHLIANGEIYNYKELQEALFKIRPEFREQFQTKSDCEVLIYLYLHYGPDFLTKVRLNGMFAFVLQGL